jgi:hypothetical protein
MSREEKNIDRIFRERLRNFDAVPPVEVWDGIRENLYLARRRKTIFWITRVAAGIAILAALSLTYFIARNSNKENQISGNEVVKTEEKLSKEKLATGESAEKKLADEVTSEEELTGAQSEKKTDSRTNEVEIKTMHEIYNPASPGDENGIYIGELKPATEKVKETHYIANNESKRLFETGVIRISINQLDYNYPDTELMTSSSELHGKPSGKDVHVEENLQEDLYALNIPEEENMRENIWAIGTEISPLYSYRSLETQNEAMSLANDLNQSETGTLAYSGGVNVSFSPLKRLSLQSGLYYSRYGMNINNAYVFEDASAGATSNTKFYSINNSSGVIDIEENPNVDYITNKGDRKQYSTPLSQDTYTTEVNSGEIIQNFEYIEVPLILRYRLIDRKIGFNLLGGFSTNLLVGSNAYYRSDGDREKIGETTDLNPFNYSSIVGLGLDYSVSKHLNISLEPTFRYYLNSINQSSIIRSYPYSVGVFTGLRYSF